MASPIAPRKVGPPLWLGVAFLILGVATAAPPTVVIASRALRSITTPTVGTPGAAQRYLGRRTWVIFQRTGTTTGGGGITFTHNSPPDLAPNQVSVTGPKGQLAVRFVTVNETITKGSRIYTAAVQFHVEEPGSYQIRLDTAGSSQVLIGRSLGETFRGFLAFALVGSLGGLLLLAGAVLLIVGGMRRSRANRPAVTNVPGWIQPLGLAPPGWYPDPLSPKRARHGQTRAAGRLISAREGSPMRRTLVSLACLLVAVAVPSPRSLPDHGYNAASRGAYLARLAAPALREPARHLSRPPSR